MLLSSKECAHFGRDCRAKGGTRKGKGFGRDSRDIQGENRPYTPRPLPAQRTGKWIGHTAYNLC